jgi:hypothetical protein
VAPVSEEATLRRSPRFYCSTSLRLRPHGSCTWEISDACRGRSADKNSVVTAGQHESEGQNLGFRLILPTTLATFYIRSRQNRTDKTTHWKPRDCRDRSLSTRNGVKKPVSPITTTSTKVGVVDTISKVSGLKLPLTGRLYLLSASLKTNQTKSTLKPR